MPGITLSLFEEKMSILSLNILKFLKTDKAIFEVDKPEFLGPMVGPCVAHLAASKSPALKLQLIYLTKRPDVR